VSRYARILSGLEHVLALAERVLSKQAPAELSATDFARVWAFRWDATGGCLAAVPEPQLFDLDDLVGVDRALAELVRNVEQFTLGFPSNHVLIFGERGTGKSSAIRGLLPRFAPRGLRLVEVHKQDLLQLPAVLAALRGAPSYRFLLFCDDLSFDAGEPQYRELKAALEGSIVAPPSNVRIAATSNRRHLIPESMEENRAARVDAGGQLRLAEVAEEKLALADRFGLVLGFHAFDQATYLRIVDRYADKAGVGAPREQLHAEALRFALDRGVRSGRTARQFVDDFAGREALEAGSGSAGPRSGRNEEAL
jgi:hypothetical protein